MIHKFEFDGIKIILDVNSGSLHVVDDIAWEIVDVFLSRGPIEALSQYKGKYPLGELEGALGELEQLQEEELLDAPDRMQEKYKPAPPHLKALCLHVAHSCNLACRYCFAGQGSYGGGKALMSKETAEQAIDMLIARSAGRRQCEIDFFGGEPLLNFAVVRHAVDYARGREKEAGKKFRFTLTTNALLFDEKVTNFCRKNDIALVLSIDGREEVHDRMRPFAGGGGSYGETLANIKKAVAARNGEGYYIRGTVSAFNKDFSNDATHLASQGFKYLSLEPVVASPSEDFALTEEDIPAMEAEYEKLTRRYLEDLQNGSPWTFFHFELDLEGGPCLEKRLTGCGAGVSYMAVTPEGELYPCHQFVGRPSFLLGRLPEATVRGDIVTMFQNAHIYNKKECKDCWAKFYCSGGCHANAFVHRGDLHLPYKTGCALMKKRLECALYIKVIRDGLAFDDPKSACV